MVMEFMQGADLFDYLQARDFKLGEDRVKDIAW
jgi:hypothetical protein